MESPLGESYLRIESKRVVAFDQRTRDKRSVRTSAAGKEGNFTEAKFAVSRESNVNASVNNVGKDKSDVERRDPNDPSRL